MTKYRVYLSATVSTAIEVEADSPDAAEGLAYNELPSLCHSCATEINSPGEWNVEEIESVGPDV